jgi:hypothetical protein
MSAELRLLNRTFLDQSIHLETHYQLQFVHSDSLRTAGKMQKALPGAKLLRFVQPTFGTDQSSLFDLSHTMHEQDKTLLMHRLDRLNLNLNRSWGTLRLGRQALSWGNGLIFHPMDLFNPFAPTEVLTDYKKGEDMATVSLPFRSQGEIQLLGVPRRSQSGSIHWDQSSLAGKAHMFTQSLEIDIMAAHHFDAAVAGLGLSGTVSGAVWRSDITWTEPDHAHGYLSAVANLDRSWYWKQKNWYGLVELYFNGQGETESEDALTNNILLQALDRGELFVLSKMYCSAALEMEWSPLTRLSTTTIFNLYDSSGVIQPIVRRDFTSDLELIAGGTIYFGPPETEFGGFSLSTPGKDIYIAPANSIFVWLTAYF